jgi:hypothetical protein
MQFLVKGMNIVNVDTEFLAAQNDSSGRSIALLPAWISLTGSSSGLSSPTFPVGLLEGAYIDSLAARLCEHNSRFTSLSYIIEPIGNGLFCPP